MIKAQIIPQGILTGSLFLCLLLSTGASGQQFNFSARAKNIQEKLLNQEPVEAEIRSLRKAEPDNLAADYLEIQSLFLNAYLPEDPKVMEAHEKHMGKLQSRLQNIRENNPMRAVALAESHLLRAALRVKLGSYIGAAWDTYNAYDYLKENTRRFPDYLPNQMGMGFLYTSLGSLPDSYRFYASIVGMRGDIELGMKMMQAAGKVISQPGSEFHFLRAKSAFILVYTRYLLLEDKDVRFAQYRLDPASSPITAYLEGKILIEQGEHRKAVVLLTRALQARGRLKFPYLHYQLGKALLSQESPDCAKEFGTYLSTYKGQNYVKSTHRYLWWFYSLRKETEQAEYHRRMVRTDGGEETGADQQALLDIDRPLNPVLIRARLAFDAGEEKKAEEELKKAAGKEPNWSQEDRAEYAYRMGRIAERTNRNDEAVRWFNQSLRLSREPGFERGNAMYQLGLIAEVQGQKEEAERWYKRCLEEQDYPFYQGLHRKCKAGISRLD